MRYHGIDIPRDKIAEFCRRHCIRKLAMFGSILRDDCTPDSDIDVLVEFEPGARTGFAFFAMQDDCHYTNKAKQAVRERFTAEGAEGRGGKK